MTIPGSLAQWEQWTGLRFPDSGPYIALGALNPVLFDIEADRGVYVETNVWMVHELAAALA